LKVAVASGKGGTGKTFVATNLARVASSSSEVVLYDLDVEEPNCHLFFESSGEETESVEMMIPVVDKETCSFCGVCADVCEFNAIITLPKEVLVFPELCHSCYGCLEMCPEDAIGDGIKTIGRTIVSRSGALTLVFGRLAIGQPATTALIDRTKHRVHYAGGIQIYDSPPGTSCPVIEAVKDTDYVVLVTEPTRFGLHDLDLMVRTLGRLEKPYGVVVNKATDGECPIEAYCRERGIELILRIPWRADIARECARGHLAAETIPDVSPLFEAMLDTLRTRSTRMSA